MASPRPDPDAPVGTLDRVAIVHTDDYWSSVSATLTPGLTPKFPDTLVLHVVSREHFEEIREETARATLYYPKGWDLERGGGPVLHDDMIVIDDEDRADEAAIVEAVRSELAVARVEVISTLDELIPADADRARASVAARTWVSLGGWCGPSLGLKRLIGPSRRGPFDFALSSLAGVDRVVLGDRSGYVPPQPFDLTEVAWNRDDEADERGIIGREHYRLPDFIHVHEQFYQDPDAWDALARRRDRIRELLSSHVGPLFLLRAVTGLDWTAERDLLVDMERRLVERHPLCEPRVIALLHSQYRGTVRLPPLAPGIDTWAVQGCMGSLVETGLPYVRYEAEYARVILRVAADDENRRAGDRWPPPPDVRRHEIADHCEHWIF